MSVYKPVIIKNSEDSFYAMVARVEGDENVIINHYKARSFKTEKAALKSTNKYIEKYCETSI